jgi:hypothetical protein
MSNTLSEIKRLQELMGLKEFIHESNKKYKKLITEAVIPSPREFFSELMVALGKKSGHSDSEMKMIQDVMDEYNEIYGTSWRYADGIDDLTRRGLSDLFGSGKELSSEVIYPAYRKWLSSKVSKSAVNLMTTDQVIDDILTREPVSDLLVRPDGTLPTFRDYLSYIYTNGSDLNKMILDGNLSNDLLPILRDSFESYANIIRRDAPEISSWLDDLVLQADEIFLGGKVATDEFIDQVDEVIDDVKTKIDNPAVEVDIPRVEDMYDIDLSDLGRVTGNDPSSLKKQVQNLMMADLEKKCKTDFCNTLIAMWKSDSQTFQNVWDELQSELSQRLKPLMERDVMRAIPQKDVDELNILLKKYSEGGKPLTALDLERLTDEVYKKIKGTNVIGMLGGTLPHWRDMKLLTTPEMRKNALKFLLWGSDVFSGEWTVKGFVTRWMKLALPITSLYTLYDFMVAYQNEDPNKTTFEQFADSLWTAVKNFGFMGLAPGVRSIIEAARYAVEKDLEEGRFVDKKTLIKYLKKNFGFSEVAITDNILPKVTYNSDAEPAYTEIKGAEGEYAVANGKYQITSSTLLGTIFTPYVEFTPEGESKSKEELEKESGLDKAAKNNAEKALEDSKYIQGLYDKKLLGKYVKYSKDEVLDGESVITFEAKTAMGTEVYIIMNYDKWKAAGAPELTETNYLDFCKTTRR